MLFFFFFSYCTLICNVWAWQHSQNASLPPLLVRCHWHSLSHKQCWFLQADLGILMAPGILCTDLTMDLMISGIPDETISASVYCGKVFCGFYARFCSCTKAAVYDAHIIFLRFSMWCLCMPYRLGWKTYCTSCTPCLIGAIMHLVCDWPVIRHTSCNPFYLTSPGSERAWITRYYCFEQVQLSLQLSAPGVFKLMKLLPMLQP